MAYQVPLDDSIDKTDQNLKDGMVSVSKQSEHTPSMFDEGQNMDDTMKSAQ